MQTHAITVPRRTEDAGGRVTLDAVESSVVREAVHYWRGLCAGRPFPARAEIVPRDLRGLLRNICLIKVLDGGADYEFRVIGDAHVIAYGFSMQGRRLSEFDGRMAEHGPVLKRLYDRVVRKREAYALRGWIERSDAPNNYTYSESLFAPLGEGYEVDHIFNASVYVPGGMQ